MYRTFRPWVSSSLVTELHSKAETQSIHFLIYLCCETATAWRVPWQVASWVHWRAVAAITASSWLSKAEREDNSEEFMPVYLQDPRNSTLALFEHFWPLMFSNFAHVWRH